MNNNRLSLLPRDMQGEIAGNLNFEDLLNTVTALGQNNTPFTEKILEAIRNGALSVKYYSLEQLQQLFYKYPILSINIIAEIDRRLATNMLRPILNTFRNESWNYSLLSENPNIEIVDILTHINKPWNYASLHMNPNITAEQIDFLVHNNVITKPINFLPYIPPAPVDFFRHYDNYDFSVYTQLTINNIINPNIFSFYLMSYNKFTRDPNYIELANSIKDEIRASM